MKTLLKNGTVVNVFTEQLVKTNVLIEDGKIIGLENYSDEEADVVEDVSGKFICPGFIDGHIHIESTIVPPAEFARIVLPHGTTSIIADPHEIANVCGTDGIEYMLAASNGIPLNIYLMIPSCVPATSFDESGAVLDAEDIRYLFHHPRVLGLAEVMDYFAVCHNDKKTLSKITEALSLDRIVDGHAPMLNGKNLDKYVASGIDSDHECVSAEEAKEKISKGMWVMVREGSAARNLNNLLPLFEKPFCDRCLLVTDDKNLSDLLHHGHIDVIIRKAVKAGKSPVLAIKMATLNAAQRFGLKRKGAVAPGYIADLLVLNSLDTVDINDVYIKGKKIVSDKRSRPFINPPVSPVLSKTVMNTMHIDELIPYDFHIECSGSRCHVIKIIKNELITEDSVETLNFDDNNGISVENDILKIAVIERHHNTGHKGLGFVKGFGLKKGAVASTVSHDSHNLIVVGTNDEDMCHAANRLRAIGGGMVFVYDGRIMSELPLPVAGLMSDSCAQDVIAQNEKLFASVQEYGIEKNFSPFMQMAFLSLPVIPAIKMTTQGLVNVNTNSRILLEAD